MENRVALIAITVSDKSTVEKLNALLHEYSDFIIGRMGLPYRKIGVSLISIAVDAPQDVINALSGKLGAIKGVNSKTVIHRI